MYIRKSILTIFLLISSCVFAQEKLIFAIDIVRHGDRTPLIDIPKATYRWQEGIGQLTPLGMRQTWQRGVNFRKKYVDQFHLLPKRYQHDALLVFSTDYERTLMSAQSILLGLYPPQTGPSLPKSKQSALPYGYQPIPIHLHKHFAWINRNTYKAQEKSLIEEYAVRLPKWQERVRALQGKFGKWSKATGIKITNLSQIVKLADLFNIYRIYKIPMLPGFTEEDVTTITQTGIWCNNIKDHTPEIAHFRVGQLLEDIAAYLQEATLHKKPLKYVLFADHDITIAGIMTLLKNPLVQPIPYAANLNFALFETDDKEHLVKISYNNQPLVIPGCTEHGCKLQTFLKLLDID